LLRRRGVRQASCSDVEIREWRQVGELDLDRRATSSRGNGSSVGNRSVALLQS
jgi:hypothetical protein